MHTLGLEGKSQGPLEWETDRARVLGRGRSPASPAAIMEGTPLSGTTGTVLDPVLCLRQRIRLAPGGSARLSFATGVASDRDTARALAQKYHAPGAAPRTFALAFTHAQIALRHLGITAEEARLFERLASRALYVDGSLRASQETIAQNELGQSGLWPYSISGDLPIVLVHVAGDDDLVLVRQVLQAQEYWRLKGLSADVVLLNENPTSYLDRNAGAAHRGPRQRTVAGLETASRRRVSAPRRSTGPCRAHAAADGRARRPERRTRRPAGAPGSSLSGRGRGGASACVSRTVFGDPSSQEPETMEQIPPMDLANGKGGFTDDGRVYTIVLDGEQETPLPWVNVIANPAFGTFVTAERRGAHLVREQPGKSVVIVHARSDPRSDGRSDLHPRR